MSRKQSVYRQQSNIIKRMIADEYILVPVSDELAYMHSFFTLNSVGQFIWESLNGVNTLETIVENIVKTFDVKTETAKSDLYQLIDQLHEKGLIVLVTEPEEK